MHANQSAPDEKLAETALVVALGKSHGASTLAAGLALVSACELDRRVLLAELDPRGGDLVEKLFFHGRPTTASEVSVPPGARELADRLSDLDLDFDPDSEATLLEEIDLAAAFTVKLRGIEHLSVLLGDPLLGVAAQAASAIAPRLKRMASHDAFDTVVVDGGRWDSGQQGRLHGVDIVYAVVEASSTSQLHRCVAEMQALWHELESVSSTNRMVVVLTELAWGVDGLVDLFLAPPGMPERKEVPYRVSPLEFNSRKENRAVALLRDGRWKNAVHIRDGLAPFRGLASVLVDHSYGRPADTPFDDGEDGAPLVEEFPYLSAESDDVTDGPDASGTAYGPEPGEWNEDYPDHVESISRPVNPPPDSVHPEFELKEIDSSQGFTSEVVEGSLEGRPLTPDGDLDCVRDETGAGPGDEWPFADFGTVAESDAPWPAAGEPPQHPDRGFTDNAETPVPVAPGLPVRTARLVEEPPGLSPDQGSMGDRARPPSPAPPVRPELAQRPLSRNSSGIVEGESGGRVLPGAPLHDEGEPQAAQPTAQPATPPSRFRRRKDES